MRRRRRAIGRALAAAVAGAALTLGAAPAAGAATTAEAVCPPVPAGQVRCEAEVLVNAATGTPVRPADVGSSTPAPAPGTPAWLRWVYDLQGLSAAGPPSPDTVAVVDAYGYDNAQADLDTFRSTYGLPPCDAGCFTKVNQTGAAGPYPAQPTAASGNGGWMTETALDVDMVSAICPSCHILLVEANDTADANFAQAEGTAAALGAQQISDSWQTPNTQYEAAYDYPNIAVVAATGDSGYPNFGVPAELPSVTAAGGTSVAAASDARGVNETVWSHTSSGCADGVGVDLVAKPSWQTDAGQGCADRTVADVAADSDLNTGPDAYGPVVSAGAISTTFFRAGGTSVATPIVAAFYALVGGGAGNGGASWAYANANAFNDITSGSDGSCAITYLCTAGPGYDGPTGLGTISGDAVGGAPQVGGEYPATVADVAATLAGGVYANQNDTQAYWQYGPTTGYGQSTTAVDAGSASGATPVSTDVSGLTPSTLYHFRLVAANCAGTSYGYDTTLTTAAPATTTTSTTTTSTSTSSQATSTASASPCVEATSTVSTTTTSSPPTTVTAATSSATTAPLVTTTTTSTTQSAHIATVTRPLVVAVAASVHVRGRRVIVPVRCSRRCSGAVILRVGGLTIGRGRVSLRTRGYAGVVSVPLNARGRRLLRRRRRVRATGTLVINGHVLRRAIVIVR